MIKGSNKYLKMAEALQGVWTLDTLADRLKITKAKAVYVAHRLRKLGFVKTWYGAGKKRVYNVSIRNKAKGKSYTDKVNEASDNPGIQVMESSPHYVYNREISYEEALVYAVKQRSIRYLIASLALFRKIENWGLLYRLSKEEKIIPQIVALYEIARRVIPKVRRMPKRFLHLAESKKGKRFSYIVQGISSENFSDIEKKWKVYLPLNMSDLEEYSR